MSEFHDDEDGDVVDADDDDRGFNFVCAEHLNLIVAADDGSFTRLTVTPLVLLPFEEEEDEEGGDEDEDADDSEDQEEEVDEEDDSGLG